MLSGDLGQFPLKLPSIGQFSIIYPRIKKPLQ